MEWHDYAGCKRLDLVDFGNGRSCLACGSIEPRSVKPHRSVLPPIRPQSEIRILHLQHGASFVDPIVCDVSAQDLRSLHHDDYEAVSYTWADASGDATRCRTITVGGQPLAVTASCETVLRRLRRQFSSRRLWIDAVCIDQQNVEERGCQVRLMPRIYSGAKAVQIYVGELTPPSQAFLESLLLANGESHGDGDSHHVGRSNSGHSYKGVHPNLMEFVSRPYFRRVWILQEVALARKATLICGNISIPWSQVSSGEISRLVQEEQDGFSISKSMIPPSFSFSHSLYSIPGQELKLLDFARHCVATDPRDKIFSLLGLIPGGKLGPVAADYSLSVPEVYMKTAIYLASQYGWMAVLYRAGVVNSSQEGMPSWVPDWTCRLRGYPRFFINLPHQPYEDGKLDKEANTLQLSFLQMPSKANTSSHTARLIVREPDLVSTMGHRMFIRRDEDWDTYAKVVALAAEFYHNYSTTTGMDLSSISPEVDLNGIKVPKLPEAPIHAIVLRFKNRKEIDDKFVLDSCGSYSGPALWPFLSAEIAVQIFTMTLTEMHHHQVLDLVDCESEWSKVDGNNTSDTTGEGVHSTTEYLVCRIDRLQELSKGIRTYQQLEDLWMREYLAGNLLKLKPDPGGSCSDSANDPDLVRINDGLWRLLVRRFVLQETTITLV
ncbi:hypothetical protein PG999_011769 [Apiospora kogelbergensis]|uniref:Heterokaryon incompatibility domain-containing protein n=1 Tax=Apiospora kogelbergensis TaxID=1337665 RepID=A0AAW0QDX2_9PEZI